MARNSADGRDTSLEDAMSTIARQALRITRLEDENSSLRAQLQGPPNGLPDARPSTESGEYAHPAAAGMYSRDQYESLAQKFQDVQSQFDHLKSQHAGCEEMLQKYLAKCKEYKDYAKGWKEWKEREMGKKKMADLAPEQRAEILLARKHHAAFDRPHHGSDDAQEPPLTPVSLVEASTDQRIPNGPKPDSPAFPSSPPQLSNGSEHRPPSRLAVPRITSSQTTVDDIPTQAHHTAPVERDASSDNEPTFVSARSLKRRGNASAASDRPAQRIKQEPNSPNGPIELNSSPWGTPERTFQHEISDLDAIGTRMITPRRPQRIVKLRERASSEEAAGHRPALLRNASSYSEGDEPAADMTDTERAQDISHNEDQSTSSARAQSGNVHQRPSSGALRPISVNIPTIPRTNNRLPNGKSKVRRTDARDNVRLLSEDGEDASQAPRVEVEELHDNRLEDLLNEPPPERTPVLTRRGQGSITTTQKNRPAAHIPTPDSMVKRPSPQKTRRSPLRRPRYVGNSPPPVRPEDEPLRNRSLHSLRLEDFKINPKYMGTTHAFTDTLRGRDARRGLHACTRPECCGGALQKIIAMGGTSMTGKTDAEALEAFLGEDWQDHMGGWNAQKRKEMVTQAHVFVFANQHGKHKSAFERRSTPPGFWDTDFPNTQQIAENRAKAEEMERNQVEDRWREAMREGGRWLFRDE